MASDGRDGALKYIDDHFNDFVARLTHIAKIRSVSDWPDHHEHVLQCAEAVKQELHKCGLENTQLLQLKDAPAGERVPPCVYGDWLHAPGQPTLLLYAHYDVQPPGVDSAWKTPAWEPTVVNVPTLGGDRLFGRGSADDKAGVIAHVAALEAILKTTSKLPVNIKVLFEGEEEIGSVHLDDYLKQYFEKLNADCMILTDTGNYDVGVPSLTYSLRGIVSLDVELKTVDHAVHSGMWGGPIIDSLTALCKLVSTLHDEHGNVTVEGFQQDVRTITEKEAKILASLHYPDEKLRQESGLLDGVRVAGGAGHTLEKIWLRPALNLIALDSCNINVSANKILPFAKARISCRIVANQDPVKVGEAVKKHLFKHAPYGAHLKVDLVDTLKPWVCVPEGAAFDAAEDALEKGYGKKAVYIGCGGSIGFVEPFAKAFGGAPAILIGVEDPYTNAHGENESLGLADWKKAMLSIVHLFHNLHGKKLK